MGDCESTIQVDAPPQVLFDYLSDIDNLPKYLPRVRSATLVDGGDAVRTVAELPNEQVMEGEAWFGVDRAAMRMAWGSEGPRDYQGELAVHSAEGGSQVWVRIVTTARVESGQVLQGVRQTLATIKEKVEGTTTTRS